MNTLKPLPNKYLKNCKLLQYRLDYLPLLPKNMVCAEVGTMRGDFAKVLLKEIEPKELHIIDLFESKDYFQGSFTAEEQYKFVEDRFLDEIVSGKVVIKKGYSWDALNDYPDKYFDFIYVDACHSYDAVKKDLKQTALKIKDNGIIAMNDYKVEPGYGVIEATNEFCVQHNYEFIYYALNGNMFSDVVLRKIVD